MFYNSLEKINHYFLFFYTFLTFFWGAACRPAGRNLWPVGFYRYRYNTGIYTGTGPVFWVPVFFVKYRNYRYFPVFFLFSRSHFFKWEMHQVVRNAPSDKRTEALLQVRPTSVDSERCFLLCNRIISPTRTQLSDYKFYTLIFIYENRNFY